MVSSMGGLTMPQLVFAAAIGFSNDSDFIEPSDLSTGFVAEEECRRAARSSSARIRRETQRAPRAELLSYSSLLDELALSVFFSGFESEVSGFESEPVSFDSLPSRDSEALALVFRA